MINLALSLAAGIIAWILTTTFTDSIWAGLLPFIIIVPGLLIYLGRRTGKKLEVIAQEAQRQMTQVQNARTPKQRDAILDRAVEVLKQGLVFKHHQFYVAAQLNAQIGQIYYVQKRFKEARPYLEQSFVRNWISGAMLGCLDFKRKDFDAMKKNFERTIKHNRKEALLWSVYAWCVWKNGDPDEALRILNRGLEVLKSDERIQANVDLLRNSKKMKMRAWKELWYQFHLESPPTPKPKIDRRAVFRGAP